MYNDNNNPWSNNQNNFSGGSPYTSAQNFQWPVQEPPKPKPAITARETVLLCASFLLSFIFSDFYVFGGVSTGLTLSLLIFYIFAQCYLSRKGLKAGLLRSPLTTFTVLLLALSHFLYGTGFFTPFNIILMYFMVTVGVAYSFNAYYFEKFSWYSFFDIIQAGLCYPFTQLKAFFYAFKGPKEQKNTSESVKHNFKAAKILIGILIVIPAAVIIISILASADKVFADFIYSIISFISEDFMSYVGHMIFGIIFIMPFMFSFLYSVRYRKIAIRLNAEKKPRDPEKGLDATVVHTVLIALLAIYLLYIFSQINYLAGGFFGRIASGYTYSYYARRGFYELMAVSVINLGIVMLVYGFIKRIDNKISVFTKVLLLLYNLSSMFLLASAFSKLLLYIDRYSLTHRRILSLWIMIVLAVVFIGISFRLFFEKFNVLKLAVIFVVLTYAVLNIVNVNSVIANYNVDRYLYRESNLQLESDESIDIGYLYNLGAAAKEPVKRLSEHAVDPDVKAAAQGALEAFEVKSDIKRDWQEFNLEDALKNHQKY